jgi:hypothetical protein
MMPDYITVGRKKQHRVFESIGENIGKGRIITQSGG